MAVKKKKKKALRHSSDCLTAGVINCITASSSASTKSCCFYRHVHAVLRAMLFSTTQRKTLMCFPMRKRSLTQLKHDEREGGVGRRRKVKKELTRGREREHIYMKGV